MSMSDVVKGVLVGVPVLNEASDNAVITALQLDNMAIWGMTYGAWMKVIIGIALLLLIVERITTIRKNWRSGNENKKE